VPGERVAGMEKLIIACVLVAVVTEAAIPPVMETPI
jgi:hypothetical protein